VRILHWLNTFLPDTGGIQTFCADLIPELMDRGHEVLLLTAHTKHNLPDATTHGRIEVRRVDSLHALVRRNPGDMLRAKIAISRIVEDFQPDLIHLHPCGPEVPYFLQVQRSRPTPTVATLHNNYATVDSDFGTESTFGRALELAGRIASVSEDAHRWLLALRPDLGPRLSTVHNGIPTEVDRPTPLPHDPPTLLFLGRIEPQKRPDVALRAFAIVASTNPDARLRIAGSGSQAAEMADLSTSLGIDSQVEFLGLVDPSEVNGLLDATTIFLMSSDYEGLPIALLEAARKGRPTVATDVGGTREVVIDGESGLLVPPDDPTALAGAIATLLSDRARADQMGAVAAQHFRDGFALGACATAYESLYEAVVAEGPLAAAPS
jgi:glycosyltransferase involved in cell wall biosynthesis